jgi:HD-GYP domain-containing protein (c-di-GMP phosphodiesterase class II)
MLAFSPALAALGAIAVQHHERLDGSGCPRQLSGDAITRPGRVLGAADAYQAMIELRPHRRAHSPEEAAAQLRARSWPDGSTAMRPMPCSTPAIVCGGAEPGPPG